MEPLPPRYMRFLEDFQRCDLLIIIGSTLVDYAFRFLNDKVPDTCPRILINPEPVKGFPSINETNRVLDSCAHISLIGDCDEMCSRLAEKLGGWRSDVQQNTNEVLKTDL